MGRLSSAVPDKLRPALQALLHLPGADWCQGRRPWHRAAPGQAGRGLETARLWGEAERYQGKRPAV